MKVIIIILIVLLVTSAAALLFLLPSLKPTDLSFDYFTSYLIDGFQIPVNAVTDIIAQIQVWYIRFSWWIFY